MEKYQKQSSFLVKFQKQSFEDVLQNRSSKNVLNFTGQQVSPIKIGLNFG